MGTQSNNHTSLAFAQRPKHPPTDEAALNGKSSFGSISTSCAVNGMNRHIHPVHLQPAPLEPFVEADEAAPFLRMSAEYLKKQARAGKIPAHPRGDGQRRRW